MSGVVERIGRRGIDHTCRYAPRTNGPSIGGGGGYGHRKTPHRSIRRPSITRGKKPARGFGYIANGDSVWFLPLWCSRKDAVEGYTASPIAASHVVITVHTASRIAHLEQRFCRLLCPVKTLCRSYEPLPRHQHDKRCLTSGCSGARGARIPRRRIGLV